MFLTAILYEIQGVNDRKKKKNKPETTTTTVMSSLYIYIKISSVSNKQNWYRRNEYTIKTKGKF